MTGRAGDFGGILERPGAFADVTGRVAFVTGASSGLGDRFVRLLAGCGAKVAVAARRTGRLDALVADIHAAGGEAVAVPLDIRDDAAITAAVAQAEAALGPVDILVDNAGINYGKRAVGMRADRFDDEMGTNLRGPWLLALAVAGRLIDRGMPGRIVNIASIGAFITSKPGAAVYSIGKAGVVRTTEVLAAEWASNFINANAIAPGIFATELTTGFAGDEMFVASLPRKRVCAPAHLDSTLLYLVSPLSEAVTGAVIKVDDGQTPR